MFQIDQASASTTLPTPAAAGAQGYFTDGNAASGVPATVVDNDFMNMIMMELINVVQATGQTPSKTTYNQVLMAIKRLTQAQVILTDTGTANAYAVANTPALTSSTWTSGVVLQFVVAHTNTGASTIAPDSLTAIPICGLGLQPLQGGELVVGGTAIVMRMTIAGVNSGNPICVLMECAGGAQQVSTATASQHAIPFGQVQAGVNYAVAAGAADALTATLASGLTALSDGFSVTIKAALANATTTPTLNLTLGTTATGAKTIVKGAGAALAAGDIAGANHELQLTYNATLGEWVLNNPATGVSASNQQQIQTVGASVASNALTATYGPDQLTFRSPTLASGALETVNVGALSLTIPSGATLGTTSGEPAELAVLVAYNGGSPVLCVVNLAGGLQMDEANLISPTTISSGAAAANVIYSASAVSASSPYRIVGYIQVAETTAGTWATAPTLVQGVGGFAGIPGGMGGLINNTSAAADIALAVGQGAYIDVSAATTVPLHIATGDNQLYEINILAIGAAASGNSLLLPNNSSYTNFIAYSGQFGGSGAGVLTNYANGFFIAGNGIIGVVSRVSTKTVAKWMQTIGGEWNSNTTYAPWNITSAWAAAASSLSSGFDTSTAWTSLGTVTFASAITGRIIIKRVA